MKKLNLNAVEGNILNERESAAIRGGEDNKPACGCACAYENNGGSSTADNYAANKKDGLHSPGGIHHIWKKNQDNETWSPCDEWIYPKP